MKYGEAKGHSDRLRLVRTSESPLFENEIISVSESLELSKKDIQEKLVELVEQKLQDIIDTPEIYIDRTFIGLMPELQDLGFIRRVEQ